MVPQMVHAGGVAADPSAALDDQHRRAGLGQHPGRDTAAGAATDDHHVVVGSHLRHRRDPWLDWRRGRWRPQGERAVVDLLPATRRRVGIELQ